VTIILRHEKNAKSVNYYETVAVSLIMNFIPKPER